MNDNVKLSQIRLYHKPLAISKNFRLDVALYSNLLLVN